MSHTITIPDELYRAIEVYAARRGETAEAAILAWAGGLPNHQDEARPEDVDGYVYDPAQDPLAAFLGRGELTHPDAIRRHDEVIADEALDVHED